MSDLWWKIVKYQTSLPQFDPELDHTTGYEGVPPVQMASAQHPQHYEQYLQGQYPKEFWAFPGKEASVAHGAAPHRSDDQGRFLDVGVRAFEPVGTKQKVGRMVPGDEMPDKRNIVVRRRSAADHPRFQRDLDKRIRRETAERKRREAKLRRRNPHAGQRGFGVLRDRNLKMLKEAKSPAALEHKRKYETEYESSPARKKYRRELERERRKRGVAGKGGKDMSHTKTGKIVPEDPHTNRARSHPSVGSTLKMIRIVKTEFAPPSEQGDNPPASTLFDPTTGKVGRSVVHGQPGMNPEEATRQVIHEDMHRATLPEVGIENMGHTEFPAMLGEELYLQRLAQEGKPHRKRDPHTLESSDPITEALYRTGKHSEVPKEQREKYTRAYAKRKNPRVAKMVIVKSPQMNLFGQSAECELCNTPMSGQEVAVSNQQLGASVCSACLMREQQQINQQNDMMYHGEPMDIAMRMLKEQKKLFVQGQKTLDGRPAFMPTDFKAEEQRRQAALREAEEKEQRRQAQIAQAKNIGLTPLPQFQQTPE